MANRHHLKMAFLLLLKYLPLRLRVLQLVVQLAKQKSQLSQQDLTIKTNHKKQCHNSRSNNWLYSIDKAKAQQNNGKKLKKPNSIK